MVDPDLDVALTLGGVIGGTVAAFVAMHIVVIAVLCIIVYFVRRSKTRKRKSYPFAEGELNF